MSKENIDLDEIDKLIEGTSTANRATNINTFFRSKEFSESVKSWKEQRDSLRESLVEFWQDKDEREAFTAWWVSLIDQIKTAVLITSVDDLQQTLEQYNNYSPLICPELTDLDQFVNKNNEEQFLFKFISSSVDSKENESQIFKGLTKMKLQFHNMDEIEEPNTIIQSLLVLRSCILLGFFVNIIALYKSDEFSS